APSMGHRILSEILRTGRLSARSTSALAVAYRPGGDPSHPQATKGPRRTLPPRLPCRACIWRSRTLPDACGIRAESWLCPWHLAPFPRTNRHRGASHRPPPAPSRRRATADKPRSSPSPPFKPYDPVRLPFHLVLRAVLVQEMIHQVIAASPTAARASCR